MVRADISILELDFHNMEVNTCHIPTDTLVKREAWYILPSYRSVTNILKENTTIKGLENYNQLICVQVVLLYVFACG